MEHCKICHTQPMPGHMCGGQSRSCDEMGCFKTKKIKPLSWSDLDTDPKAGINKINEIIEVLKT